MEMLLMGICFSVFAMAIAAAAFGAATKTTEAPKTVPEVKAEPAIGDERFFVTQVTVPTSAGRVSVPVEALIAQLERHVRLEQAAAASFLAEPTSALLHSKTASPFLN
jgi:hypothetical protein